MITMPFYVGPIYRAKTLWELLTFDRASLNKFLALDWNICVVWNIFIMSA